MSPEPDDPQETAPPSAGAAPGAASEAAPKHESLEAERDFLLRSLDDLDNERAAGNIDDGNYERLHADYTARAAAVLRQIRDGLDIELPKAQPVSRRRRLVTIGVVAVFALTSAGLLANSLRTRSPGGQVTGDNPNTTVAAAQREATLIAAVKKHPKDYLSHIALARFYLGNDLGKSVKEYDAAAKLDPKQPEPFAYGGWIRGIVAGQLGKGTNRTLLLRTAFDRFAHAIDVAPSYPDTFVFRGIVHFQVMKDSKAAIPDFQRYLELAPQDDQYRQLVLGALAQAVADAKPKSGASTTTVPTTTKP